MVTLAASCLRGGDMVPLASYLRGGDWVPLVVSCLRGGDMVTLTASCLRGVVVESSCEVAMESS